MVRGLALRSLTSLRLESIIEYVEQPLEKALSDLSAYVRKTGVMGVLKIHHLRRSVIEQGSYVEQLVRNMLTFKEVICARNFMIFFIRIAASYVRRFRCLSCYKRNPRT